MVNMILLAERHPLKLMESSTYQTDNILIDYNGLRMDRTLRCRVRTIEQGGGLVDCYGNVFVFDVFAGKTGEIRINP